MHGSLLRSLYVKFCHNLIQKLSINNSFISFTDINKIGIIFPKGKMASNSAKKMIGLVVWLLAFNKFHSLKIYAILTVFLWHINHSKSVEKYKKKLKNDVERTVIRDLYFALRFLLQYKSSSYQVSRIDANNLTISFQ